MIKELFKKIRSIRESRGFSQEYVARELGLSRPTYGQIENGERELNISEAEKLASIFSMTLNELLKGDVKEIDVEMPREIKKKKTVSDIQIRVTRKNLDKFKQVLLYVLGKVGGKPNVGETVLHKLLYFIDFDYFEKFEENLMGATYIKNHHGPTSVELHSVIADMQKDGELEKVNSKHFQYDQKKYLPLKRPNLGVLSAQEVDHIDDVLARLSDKNAKEIENYSHEDIPWKVADDGQPINYESVFYRDDCYSVRNYDDEL